MRLYFNYICICFEKHIGKSLSIQEYLHFKDYYNRLVLAMFDLEEKKRSDYYRALAKQLDVKPEECLMVGNDVSEDMIAETVGMSVFLLTDCIINKENKDISTYSKGSFDELAALMFPV